MRLVLREEEEAETEVQGLARLRWFSAFIFLFIL
jgi:hypothetical protein